MKDKDNSLFVGINMDELVEIGTITKPQGLKGELKIQLISPNAEHFLPLKYIYLYPNQKHNILKSRFQSGFAYVILDGVNSVEEAEKLRNKLIYIDRSQLPTLDKDEYYFRDLMNCAVKFENGEYLGDVIDISDYSSVNNITIKNSQTHKEIIFPFLNQVISNVDLEKKEIIVKQKEFDEVRVDED